MSRTDLTRLSLLLRLRNRTDQSSWSEFHARHGHMIYRYARARGANHSDAEDVVQDVEMQLLQAIDGFAYDARKGRFRADLRASAVHALGRRAQRQSRQPTGMDPLTFDQVAAEHAAQMDKSWTDEWQLHHLRWAVQSIAGEFEHTALKAFELHVLAGCPVAETAETLAISKWRVYRARTRVLRRLKGKLSELSRNGDAM